MKQPQFSTLALPPKLLATLGELDYQSMTPIQAQSLPEILKGHDLIAQARTGSGKTAAFGLGLLARLEVKRFWVQSLVLCPTRELADQVANEIRRLGRGIHNIKVLTLCGGQPFGPQLGSLEHGAHIIVGTPGRVLEHVEKGTLKLNKVQLLVLDEADRMLDMGFQPALDAIVEQIPASRQSLLFSATYPSQIQDIAQRFLRNPLRVTVADGHDDSSIEQHFYLCPEDHDRLQATHLLLLHHRPESVMVFANTKKAVQQLCDELGAAGFSVASLHGDLEQKQRDQTLVQFANGSVVILVATDVAARGLDISAVDLVINYQLAHDPEVHVHRVGRTGRAGSQGQACSLYNDKDHHKIRCLEDTLGRDIVAEPLPAASLLQQQPSRATMVTLQIDGGKKNKLRPGDILGALTGGGELAGSQVGKINITALKAFVAVERSVAKRALKIISEGQMKGRNFRARILRA